MKQHNNLNEARHNAIVITGRPQLFTRRNQVKINFLPFNRSNEFQMDQLFRNNKSYAITAISIIDND